MENEVKEIDFEEYVDKRDGTEVKAIPILKETVHKIKREVWLQKGVNVSIFFSEDEYCTFSVESEGPGKLGDYFIFTNGECFILNKDKFNNIFVRKEEKKRDSREDEQKFKRYRKRNGGRIVFASRLGQHVNACLEDVSFLNFDMGKFADFFVVLDNTEEIKKIYHQDNFWDIFEPL